MKKNLFGLFALVMAGYTIVELRRQTRFWAKAYVQAVEEAASPKVDDYDRLQADFDELTVVANQSLYLAIYLITRHLGSGEEFSEFDWHVLRNPPESLSEEIRRLFDRLMVDPENSDLLEELIEAMRETIPEADES